MRTAKSVGRTIGVLFLARWLVAPLVNFVLLGPAITTPPGFPGECGGELDCRSMSPCCCRS